MFDLHVLVQESPWLYAVRATLSEVDDTGHRSPVMTRMVTTAKTEADGFEGCLEALKAVLFG